MKGMGTIFKTAGILLCGILGGGILLSLVFLIPVNETNKEASYDIIAKEGWYPAVPIVSASLDTYFHSLLPGVLDDSTDALMLRTALEPDEPNVIRAAMDMRQYEYYWHGYVTVLRPLLAVFDYGEIRVLNGMLQMLLVFFLCLLLKQKKGVVYALLALSSYFLLMPLAMPFSLQYSWVFYITAGCLLCLVLGTGKRDMGGMRLYRLFLAVGMLTSFFDLLTYPLYTWGVPVIWLLLLSGEDKNQWHYVKQVIYTGLWWLLGYAGMWLGKFCLGSLVLRRNIFEKAFLEAGLHLGVEDKVFSLSERLEVLYTNWKHYEYKLYVLLLAVWLLFVVVCTLQKGVRGNVKNKALALVGASPAVWYFSLTYHTRVHHFFTWRIWGIAVLAVSAVLLGSLGDRRLTGRRQVAKILCLWAACGILGCGFSLLAREDIFVINGDREYRQVELKEGEACEMRFTPSFPSLKYFGLCLSTDARGGVCHIILSDGGRQLYDERIGLEEYGESTYAVIPVDWRLKRGREYTLRLELEQADAGVWLLVTDQEMPLSEYGEVSVGGNGLEGQILSGLTYSYRPLSHFTLFFLAMTWTGLLFAVCMVFFGQKSKARKGV